MFRKSGHRFSDENMRQRKRRRAPVSDAGGLWAEHRTRTSLCANSSTAEPSPHKRRVAGSTPAWRTGGKTPCAPSKPTTIDPPQQLISRSSMDEHPAPNREAWEFDSPRENGGIIGREVEPVLKTVRAGTRGDQHLIPPPA